MDRKEQLKFINFYREHCNHMTNEALKEFYFFVWHDMNKTNDKHQNIFDKIVYDCTCAEMYNRGLCKIEKYNLDLLWRVSGIFDYNNLDRKEKI